MGIYWKDRGKLWVQSSCLDPAISEGHPAFSLLSLVDRYSFYIVAIKNYLSLGFCEVCVCVGGWMDGNIGDGWVGGWGMDEWTDG